MKILTSRISALLLIIAMICLSGCGPDGSTSSATVSPNSSENAETQITDTAEEEESKPSRENDGSEDKGEPSSGSSSTSSKPSKPKKPQKTSSKDKNPSSAFKGSSSEEEIEETESSSPSYMLPRETEMKITKKYDFENPFVIPDFQYGWHNDSHSGVSLPYRYCLPLNYEKGKKYPIVIYLHGAGEVGTDNEIHVSNISRAFPAAGDIARESIFILPQTPYGWSYGGGTGVLDAVKRLIDKMAADFGGDKNRIYIMGLSLGGFATWNITDTYGGYFAAAAPICGGVHERGTSALVGTPIWTYHGDADDVVSYYSTEATYQSIVNAGGKKIKLIKLKGVGHNAWDYAFTDRELFSWMFSQKKGGNQSLKYTYRNCFEIISPSGKLIISDKDLTDVFTDSDSFINFEYNDEALARFDRIYSAEKTGSYTLKIGGQKVYDFKITHYSGRDYIRLEKIFSEEEYSQLNKIFGDINYSFDMQKLAYEVKEP